ncbi:hypothetical protein [Corallococcus sp. Z5C101001]|uniref:DUF6923 family protein n=1 Tax=Corallococcus sp. Z5C101001 TaxID=2596829 RepID=UPI00117DE62A|nr:hypothetical protein [Corallococcus sp. Z5C101001]TSC31242.1 hypothetical protein FOF48_11135 [Corallococcus sp. Z5C101001]
MHRRWLGVMLGGALWAPAVWAHDFRADKLVNGQKQVLVDRYPTTLSFSFTATNVHQTLPSDLLQAADPLLANCTFSPAPPLSVPVGGNIQYTCEYTVDSYEACVALGALDASPNTPNEEVSFANILDIGWDVGSSQSSVNVLCQQQPILYCDDTVYISTASSSGGGLPTGPSRLYIFDPATGTLALQGEASLPYNALAFNHVDNFLYAISSDGLTQSSFIRLDANGSATVIAPLVTGAADSAIWAAGAILEDGTYLGFEGTSNHLVHVDTTTGAVLSDVILGTPATFRMADFAVNPLNNQLYGFNSVTQRVAVVDPVLGTYVDYPLPSLINGAPSVNNAMVSATFTAAGELFFYGTTNADSTRADTFYSVDLLTGALSPVSTGPATQFADGAACAFNLPPRQGGLSRPVTRDRGFFGSSQQALTECLSQGPISLGALGHVSTVEEALGVLWANSAFAANNTRRSDEATLRMLVAREQVTSVCNERYFGTTAPVLPQMDHGLPMNAFVLADTLKRLEVHNQSGLRTAVPLAKQLWKLDPIWGMTHAQEPKL